MSRHPDLGPLRTPSESHDTAARAELLRHVGECAHCRTALAAEDPTRLFALLALASPPEGVLERLSLAVDEQVVAPAIRRSRTRVAAGALAASLVLAGLLGGLLWRGTPAPGPARAERTAPEKVEALRAAPVNTIEISSPGTAQLLDLSVGDTQLIMIFDEALDI